MEDPYHKVPTNADEYADSLPKSSTHLPNVDVANTRSAVAHYYSQINPIDPVTPSNNWATEKPRKGFNMDHLNTYIIRPSDRLQAAMFDRFILKEDAGLFPGREENDMTLGRLISKKIGKPIEGKFSRKRYDINGPLRDSPKDYKTTAQEKSEQAASDTAYKNATERMGGPGYKGGIDANGKTVVVDRYGKTVATSK